MATKKIYMQRTCVQDNKVTNIFVEEVTREEFDNYKTELQKGLGGCNRVEGLGPDSFVSYFTILGEKETEFCRIVRLSRNFLCELLAGTHVQVLFSFKQNKRKRMPDRSVEIIPSPWDKPDCRNFAAAGIIKGSRVWCDNGLPVESAATTILAAQAGD